MLDDQTFIAKYDVSNALGIIGGQPDQLTQDYDTSHIEKFEVRNIVLAGMGGSALAAEFTRSWLSDRLPVPFVIDRDYNDPGFVNENTLFIASSYSGNTEETISALEQAAAKKAHIVILTAGGKEEEIAKEKNYPLLLTPSGLQPRLAVLYGVKALCQLFDTLELTKGATDELMAGGEWAKAHIDTWVATAPAVGNVAKQIAQALFGSPVVVYGGPSLAMPTMKWKIDINENAKNVAFYNILSELDHNEFQGWIFPERKQLKVVELQSSFDNDRIKKRFEVTNRLLSGHMPAPIIVQAIGESKLEQMLWTLLLGDFVSAYLAFLNGIDPTPVKLVEQLKKDLG